MKKVILLLIVLISYHIAGQSISKQVIGSSGQPISNGSYTINFTVGEAIVGEVINGVNIHQGFWAELSNDETLTLETLINPLEDIQVFPNPVVNLVQIRFKLNETENYKIQLFDINGKEIHNLKQTVQEQTKQLNISHLSSGMYLLTVRNPQSNYIKTFKILKQ